MNSNTARTWLLTLTTVFVAGGGLGLGGCNKKEATATAATAKADVAKPAPKDERWPLAGEILRVEKERKILVVMHDEIPNYMPAMTMEFEVGGADLAAAKVGQKIRAEMVSQKDSYRLENIWPNEKAETDTVLAGAKRLAEDTHNRGKEAYREIGEAVPDFALYDQNGKVVQSARFKGKQVIINFIFTRCPLANMCPESTLKMMSVQKLAKEAAIPNLELVSITLDPTYDTPAILKEYADVRGIDTANFSFLTGPEAAIKNLFVQFGIIAEFDGKMLKHNLATVLLNEDGKIVHRTDGPRWEAKEFVAKMKK